MLDKQEDLAAPRNAPRPRPTTLRDALKHSTDERHQALDARLSALNLLKPERRAEFCRIQLLGFRSLRAACAGDAAEGSAVLHRQIDALEAECGVEPEARNPTPVACLHPDAVAYVTLGAQMGNAMMRRALPEDQQTGPFGLEPDMAAWRAFCERMRSIDPDEAQAHSILRDARDAFSVFLAAADEVLGQPFPTEAETEAALPVQAAS